MHLPLLELWLTPGLNPLQAPPDLCSLKVLLLPLVSPQPSPLKVCIPTWMRWLPVSLQVYPVLEALSLELL